MERPAPVRIHVALSQSRPHSEARDRPSPVDVAGVSSSVGASQVPAAVHLEVPPEEARAERAGRGPDPSHRRTQVAESSLRLSADCARIISQTFGVEIDKNVVYRVLSKHYRQTPGGDGPSWLSLIGHTTDSLWSVDLFRSESIVLRSYWVLVVMDQFTPRLVGFGVHGGAITGVDVCRMFNAAVHGQGMPRHLSTDHDPV